MIDFSTTITIEYITHWIVQRPHFGGSPVKEGVIIPWYLTLHGKKTPNIHSAIITG